MVHEKYIRKNGKLYGPYLYKNQRVDGKVVTSYLGIAPRDSKIKNINFYRIFLITGILLVILLSFFVFSRIQTTGRASIDINSEYEKGEELSGVFRLNIKQGELVPRDSKIIVSLGEDKNEFNLADLVDVEAVSGSFFVEGFDLSGSGEGYGVSGGEVVYPDVDFDLRIFSTDSGSSEESGDVVESENSSNENNIDDAIVEEEQDNAVEPDNGETNEGIVESIEEPANSENTEVNEPEPSIDNSLEEPSITGEVVSESGFIVSGTAGKDKDFTYSLENGQNAEIVPSSVKVSDKEIGDSQIELNIGNNQAVVSTDYALSGGFGEDYLGDESLVLEIDISKLNLSAEENSNLHVELVYDGNILADADKEIVVDESDSEGIINVDLINESINEINASLNDSLPLINATSLNVSVLNETTNASLDFITINTKQFDAVIGQPVKWVKTIDSSKAVNVVLEIPLSAENVSVKQTDKSDSGEIEEINIGELENVKIDADGGVLTGEVTADINLEGESRIAKFFKRIFSFTGFAVSEESVQEIAVEVNGTNGGIVEVEYYTAAPSISFEEETNKGKRVVISSPEGVHYENVLVYIGISESLNLKNSNLVRIYWEENNTLIPPLNISDLDNDGIYDYISWIAPHLSNQTFEIILIVKAEHLDANRIFIEDIYEDVKAIDNLSASIPVGDFVRVTFEQNLTSERDITVYARSSCEENQSVMVNGTEVPCDIYKKKLRIDELRRLLG